MEGLTRRRVLLAAFPAGISVAAVKPDRKLAQTPAQLGEFVRQLDPITETPVVRLTTPTYTNLLPSPANRFVAAKARVLVFSSDRYGKLAPHQADLRTGLIRPIAEAQNLDSASLILDEAARNVYYLDAGFLTRSELSTSRSKNRTETLAEGVTAFCLGTSPAEFFAIRNSRLVRVAAGQEQFLADAAFGPCEIRPGGNGCLFWRGGTDTRELWHAPSEPASGKPVRLASGAISSARWSAGGQSILFLREVPKENSNIAELREVQLGGAIERTVAFTSQFAVFSPNGDDTVFVGASKSKAQPNVILLLRSVQRELTLCEHHASQPATVKPVFSPNSQRVYFQSDREGKPAIYSVNVEQLVEPT